MRVCHPPPIRPHKFGLKDALGLCAISYRQGDLVTVAGTAIQVRTREGREGNDGAELKPGHGLCNRLKTHRMPDAD